MIEEKKKELKQKYVEFQLYQQQAEQLAKYMEDFEMKISLLTKMEESLGELKSMSGGTEILVPVGEGIFARATLEETNSFIVSVGAGIGTQKTRDEVVQLIKEQLTLLTQNKEILAEKVQVVNAHMLELASEVEKLSVN